MQNIMKAAVETIAEKNEMEYAQLVAILSGDSGADLQKKAAAQVAALISSILK